MKQFLIFHTGETTCSEKPSYPGSMCPFVYVKKFGTSPVCHLFNDTPLHEEGGWLQRHKACLQLFKGASTMEDVNESIL